MTTKEAALRVIDAMPDDISWDELERRLMQERWSGKSDAPSEADWFDSPGDVPSDPEEYKLYLRKIIDEADRQIDAGLGLTQEEVETRFARWLE